MKPITCYLADDGTVFLTICNPTDVSYFCGHDKAYRACLEHEANTKKQKPNKQNSIMTREEITQHYMSVVAAVFHAEDVVRPQWEDRLRACRGADKDTKNRTADAYLRAISEEILSTYSDELLQTLYGHEAADIEP